MGHFEKNFSEMSLEKFKLNVNESMLKSRGMFVCFSHDDGSLEYYNGVKDLNYSERVGLYYYLITRVEELLDREIPPIRNSDG